MTDEVLTPIAYDPDAFGWTVSPEVDRFFPAFVTALGELKDVTRSRTANAGTYQYRYADLGDVVAEVRTVFAGHGLAVFQVARTVTDGVTVSTTIVHTSGQWLAFDPLRLPAGQTAQTIGSAITYARRYAVMAALGLATEDDDGAAASRGAPQGPTLMAQSTLDKFRDAAADAGLDQFDIEAIVQTATDGRTNDVEAVWESEVAALRAALHEYRPVPPGDTGEGSGDAAREPDPSSDQSEPGE